MSTNQLNPTGPARPVPPRSRSRAHLAGLALAVVGAPVAYALLARVTDALGHVYDEERAPSLLTDLLLLAATAIVVATVWWNRRSSVGSAVAGGIWLLVGLGAILDLPEDQALLGSLDRLTESPGAIVLGIALLGSAGAASVARRQGRWTERRDQEIVATSGVTAAPGSRLPGHIVSVVVGLVVGPLTLVLFLGFETLLLSRHAEGDASLSLTPVTTLVMLGLALVALFAAGAWSSLGLVVAGAFWFVVGASSLVFPLPWENPLRGTLDQGLRDLLGFISLADAPWFAATFVIGATLLAAALGVHLARRDGRSVERRELRLIRERDAA